jgi:hypothetical protein
MTTVTVRGYTKSYFTRSVGEKYVGRDKKLKNKGKIVMRKQENSNRLLRYYVISYHCWNVEAEVLMGQKMEATISPEMLVPTSQSRLTTS